LLAPHHALSNNLTDQTPQPITTGLQQLLVHREGFEPS
jgi:hypothetical protein